jgi:hypothetical protein
MLLQWREYKRVVSDSNNYVTELIAGVYTASGQWRTISQKATELRGLHTKWCSIAPIITRHRNLLYNKKGLSGTTLGMHLEWFVSYSLTDT